MLYYLKAKMTQQPDDSFPAADRAGFMQAVRGTAFWNGRDTRISIWKK